MSSVTVRLEKSHALPGEAQWQGRCHGAAGGWGGATLCWRRISQRNEKRLEEEQYLIKKKERRRAALAFCLNGAGPKVGRLFCKSSFVVVAVASTLAWPPKNGAGRVLTMIDGRKGLFGMHFIAATNAARSLSSAAYF